MPSYDALLCNTQLSRARSVRDNWAADDIRCLLCAKRLKTSGSSGLRPKSLRLSVLRRLSAAQLDYAILILAHMYMVPQNDLEGYRIRHPMLL